MQRPMPFSPMKLALSRKLQIEANMATTLQEEHRLVENACAQLEDLADALPALPSEAVLEALTFQLREAIPAHCRHEESVMTPPPSGPDSKQAAHIRAFELLMAEHATNEAIAHELADALEDCMHEGVAPAPEALGQLARQFFVLMRRHMAWEEYVLDVLLPIVAETET